MTNKNKFNGINIQILKMCNYNLDDIDNFIEQFKDFRDNVKKKKLYRNMEK